MDIGSQVVVEINGAKEVGTVVKSGARTIHVKLDNLSKKPVIKVKKKRILRTIFGGD